MKNIAFADKKALIRVDFNVPLENGHVSDDTRIKRAIPTIEHVLSSGGAVILMSHLGRPQKKKLDNDEIDVDAFTLNQIVPCLSHHLGLNVKFANDCGGRESKQMADDLRPGEVLLLENTRFYPGESQGDVELAKNMASLADIYINDAFGTAHRAHASTTTVAQFFNSASKAFGLLMLSELENAKKVLDAPTSPFTAILGGAKVSDKIALIENLMDKTDNICIGGGMAYTFFKAKGGHIGSSLCEDDRLDMATHLLEKAKEKNTRIHLPIDSIVADSFSDKAKTMVVKSNDIPEGWMGLDIGPQALEEFKTVARESKTIIWNGPMGVFEMSSFNKGTFGLAQTIAETTQTKGAYSLIGGGDSVAAINESGLSDQVSFISTGGGAMLELLEGKTLPGVAAILDND